MQRLLNTTTITLLALAFPLAALADLSGKVTLTASQAVSLDTGTTTPTGGDILWNGSSIAPQGGAAVSNLSSSLGAQYFANLTQTALSFLPYSSTPIPLSQLTTNDIFAVHTNGRNYSAVLVTAVSATTITLQFNTFGAAAGGGSGPSISQVLNNYGLIPAGFPNSGISPGTLFIIKGSGLADPTKTAQLQDSTIGLPTTLNGASVKVTSGGVTVTPAFYYAIAAQLALVLPSNTPTGSATVTVTYNGQASAPFTFQVVSTAMGFGAYYGTGSGLGIAVNTSTGALYNYGTAILPGATVLLYGSGLGADSARDSQYVGAAFNINNLAHIYVGGWDATIIYQGASGFPGLNQVNLTIPSNAPLGCNIPITGVTAAGIPTNTITVPISVNGPCTDSAFGITGTQLQNLSGKATVNTGFVGIGQTTSGTQTISEAFASFQSYTGSTYASGGASGSVSLNSCIVSQNLGGSGGSVGTTTPLNPGTVTVTGPTGPPVTLAALPGVSGYLAAQLAAGFIPSTGGAFAFAGTGGNTPTGGNVGNFSMTVSFSNPLLTWTNQSAASTVNRASGLLVQWNGGAITSFVIITGSASSGTAFGSFTCYVPASNSQFQVPGYITSALPAGPGSVSVSNYTNYSTFTAAGLDLGVAAGFIGYDTVSTFN